MINQEHFSLQYGPLKFDKKALGNLLFGIFFIGLLAGVYSMIHFQNPSTPFAVTSPILMGLFIPVYFITKGVRKVSIKDQQKEKINVPETGETKTLSDAIESPAEVNAI